MNEQILEADFGTEEETVTSAVSVRTQVQAVAEYTPMTSKEVVDQVRLIQEVMEKTMVDGEHYGKIPGCGDKPALLKSGAEKLSMTFRLRPKFKIERTDLPDHHREYEITCAVYDQYGVFHGEGVGTATTMESKWRYVNDSENTGKPVPKEYWDNRDINLIGGKGHSTKKVEGQWFIFRSSGKKERENIADMYNTVKKIAKKRAFVDAILTATAASDLFTQDIEELGGSESGSGGSMVSDMVNHFKGSQNATSQASEAPVKKAKPKKKAAPKKKAPAKPVEEIEQDFDDLGEDVHDPIPEPDEVGEREPTGFKGLDKCIKLIELAIADGETESDVCGVITHNIWKGTDYTKYSIDDMIATIRAKDSQGKKTPEWPWYFKAAEIYKDEPWFPQGFPLPKN
jgi:hypothetical protein